MKSILVVLVASLLMLDVSFGQNSSTSPQKLTLKVTSSSDKPIWFVASMFFKTNTVRMDHTIQQTPFELTVESNYVNATIIKTSGEGDLVVDLIKANKIGDQPNLKASSSTVVVVGTQDAIKGIYYQHTF